MSEGYARLSGAGPRVPWGGTAERGVGGIWDIGEKPALRFRSSNAARHEFRERPVTRQYGKGQLNLTQSIPGGSGVSSQLGCIPRCITMLSRCDGEGDALLRISASK